MLRSYPLAILGLLLCLTYLTADIILNSKITSHEVEFITHSLFLKGKLIDFLMAPYLEKPLFPLNYPILIFQSFRFGAYWLTGLMSLAAYLSIGSGTYALARRYAWPPTALMVAMIVMSMPHLLVAVKIIPMELFLAAAALFSLLVMYRVVEQPQFIDLALLILGIAFCVSDGKFCLVLPLVLTGLGLILLFRRHPFITWKRLILENRKKALFAALSWTVLSQFWVFILNIYHQRSWVGSYSKKPILFNLDGFYGSIANWGCYLFESSHLTLPIDKLFKWGFGIKLTQLMQLIYAKLIIGMFEYKGGAASFRITWDKNPGTIWFGPFGLLLILPVLGYALVRGPRRLKSTALALCGYLYLITLILAWQPANAGLFTPFYVCSGFSYAFFLPPWRMTKTGRRMIQEVCFLLFFYSFYLIKTIHL